MSKKQTKEQAIKEAVKKCSYKEECKEFQKEILIKKFDKFVEEHIIEDEIDGVERTLVDFNYNEWIRFKKELNSEVCKR